EVSPTVLIRPVSIEDQAILPEVFAAAFEGVQPFGGLDREERLGASRAALAKTWVGGDGPWVREASFTAVHAEKGTPLGGVMITLVPGGDPGRVENYRWQEPPPVCPCHPALAEGDRVRGQQPFAQPHVTWIFVAPLWKAGGVGSALLASAVKSLQQLGYSSLW